MSISRATIYTRVKTRIRADLATPLVDDLHDNSINTWAQEKCAQVIELLDHNVHFPSLFVPSESLTFTTSNTDRRANLPSTYQRPVALRVTGTSASNRKTRILETSEDFRRFDSSNFLLTPTENRPIAFIGSHVFVLPTTLTTGRFDYIKAHPTIDGSNGTVFDELGDEMLILFIVSEYFSSVPQRHDLAEKALQEALAFAKK